jgi:hypothetical protein
MESVNKALFFAAIGHNQAALDLLEQKSEKDFEQSLVKAQVLLNLGNTKAAID